MVKLPEDPFAGMRRKLENLFGWPLGSFDPPGNLLKDLERVNKALGTTFTPGLGPEELRRRIQARIDSKLRLK